MQFQPMRTSGGKWSADKLGEWVAEDEIVQAVGHECFLVLFFQLHQATWLLLVGRGLLSAFFHCLHRLEVALRHPNDQFLPKAVVIVLSSHWTGGSLRSRDHFLK